MDLSDRKKKILAALIDDYIETAEPVGSKVIASKTALGLSSATIRNELSELTSMGFLEQPHTSAGRTPTPRGYRIYVNELMRRHRLSVEEAEAINRELRGRLSELDRLISDVGKLASRLTSYPAYALSAPAVVTAVRFDFIHVDANTFIIVALFSDNTVKNKLVRLPQTVEQEALQRLASVFNVNFTGLTADAVTEEKILAAERVSGDSSGLVRAIALFTAEALSEAGSYEAHFEGGARLLTHPEYRDAEKASRLLSFMSDGDGLLSLPPPEGSERVKVIIGPENLAEELCDSSVVMASYAAGEGTRGLIGIVGPTRMDYSKVAARLKYLAGTLGRLLTGEPPPVITDDQGDVTENETG